MKFFILTGTHKDDLGIGGQGSQDVSKNVRRQQQARQRSWCATSKEACLRWRDSQSDADDYQWTTIGRWRPKKAKRRMSKKKLAARRSAGLLSG
jgi:hypothetical protein